VTDFGPSLAWDLDSDMDRVSGGRVLAKEHDIPPHRPQWTTRRQYAGGCGLPFALKYPENARYLGGGKDRTQALNHGH
jgi:hypothetical protein